MKRQWVMDIQFGPKAELPLHKESNIVNPMQT